MQNVLPERKQNIVDVAVLLAVVCLAVGTWLCFSESAPPWKAYISVVITMLFALASLTRQPYWAVSTRLLIGGWMIAAPCLLGFGNIAPALWTYLAIGSVVSIAAISDIALHRARLAGAVSDQVI